MRIVHFEQMFHPEFGDQINIISKLQVSKGHEVFIVTGSTEVLHPRFKNFADNSNMEVKDEIFEKETGVKIYRIGIKKFISGRAVFEKGYKKFIDKLEPDLLYCHYNDTIVGMYYTLISKKLKYPVIFDSHMLDIAAKNKFKKIFRLFYKICITPIIKKNKLIVIKTQDDPYINKELGIPEILTPIISFGSDTDLFKPNNTNRVEFRKKHSIEKDAFIILYTGQLNKDKGIDMLLEVCSKPLSSEKKVVLVLVGKSNEVDLDLINEFQKKSINKIIIFPTQKYKELPKFYQMSDLSIFPKQSSLSFYDAQACGLPVIAEANSLNLTRLNFKNGITFKPNNLNDLKSKLEFFLNMPPEEFKEYRDNSYGLIKRDYNYSEIINEYERIIQYERKKYIEDKK